jgi:hypothetical protein
VESVSNIQEFEQVLVTHAQTVLDSLIETVEATVKFVPGEATAIGADLVAALKGAKADVQKVAGGGS